MLEVMGETELTAELEVEPRAVRATTTGFSLMVTGNPRRQRLAAGRLALPTQIGPPLQRIHPLPVACSRRSHPLLPPSTLHFCAVSWFRICCSVARPTPYALSPAPHVASVPAAAHLSRISQSSRTGHYIIGGYFITLASVHCMPPTKKQLGPDAQPNVSQGRRPGNRNRQNPRSGRPRWPKHEPAHDPVNETSNPWGPEPPAYETWGEVKPSNWDIEENTAWVPDDWALESYTRPKIEAWRRQVEDSIGHDLVRTPSATSDGGTTSSTQPIKTTCLDATPALEPTGNSNLHRWALDFLNRAAVSADRKRRALEFVNQPLRQRLESIYVLLRELSGR